MRTNATKPKLTRQGMGNNLSEKEIDCWEISKLWAYCHPLFREEYQEQYSKLLKQEAL